MRYKITKPLAFAGAPLVGSVLVECTAYDYGLRRDHEILGAEPHINLSADGGYPFFTVPISATEPLGQ